jgi:hypothetical protein
MNVFLLDPEERVLAEFVWVDCFNNIGRYVLLDWNKEEYVFLDTSIRCVSGLTLLCDVTCLVSSSFIAD